MTELIAELSSAHGGSESWQTRMVEDVAEAGFDTVKFQSYQTRHLSPEDPQYAWLKQAELSATDHYRLMKLCQTHGLKFLTTVFDVERVSLLYSLGATAIKVGSGEGGNERLLHAIAEHPWKVYVSTGLMTLLEMEAVKRILALHEVVFMHTVSEYPTPIEHANLMRLRWLKQHMARPVGYSDHTTGIAAPSMAMTLGAHAVEVHYSPQNAPRHQPWDKSKQQLSQLSVFNLQVQAAKTPHRMAWPIGEERPFVGRWSYGG